MTLNRVAVLAIYGLIVSGIWMLLDACPNVSVGIVPGLLLVMSLISFSYYMFAPLCAKLFGKDSA